MIMGGLGPLSKVKKALGEGKPSVVLQRGLLRNGRIYE